MKKFSKSFSVLILVTFIITNILLNIPAVSAQSVAILGEIKTGGSVFIRSSNGQWAPSGKTYPLLQDTAIRTDEGTASLYFRDGSRIDLSKDTTAVIGGSDYDYSVKLAKGIIAFNISPSASLTVSAGTAAVYANNKKGLVQKVGYDNSQRALGAVSVTDRGTEVRSISGKISVAISASGTNPLLPGETIFIGSDGKYRVYKTQAITKKGGGSDYLIKKDDLLQIKTEGFEGIYKVDSRGRITLPPGMDFHVEGLTTAEVEKMIAEDLAKSLEKTIVTVMEKQKAVALLPESSSGGSTAAGIIAGGFAATVTVLSFDVWRDDDHRVASPSVP
ncbi:MAG: polysaccharide biosynthesis/export family protein [Nitrospirota bacterium]